eukprot:CAMPEP_0118940220 /NCGR_PEP_ID=MMETSP1169-20130426/30878_1 /TAXON_ID=36882 /ORGANISM="Pyramimonas obovata, Strain CCMP722" /LENGTH=43 /DNA_ID= /DNA_START= /DNA_END= /DNA_ORIENTATION=
MRRLHSAFCISSVYAIAASYFSAAASALACLELFMRAMARLRP